MSYVGITIVTWAQADWYVDPVAGNDANDGRTPATAVRTVMGGVVENWGTIAPRLRQTTTLHILNPQALNVEQIVLAPTLVGLVNFIIEGTVQPVPGGAFVLGAVTPKNRATNTPLSAAGFPAAAAEGQLVFNETRSTWAWVRSVPPGGGVATISQPTVEMIPGTSPLYTAPAEDDGWAAGNSMILFTPCALNLRQLAATGEGASDVAETLGIVWLNKIKVLDAGGAPATSSMLWPQPIAAWQLSYIEPYVYSDVSFLGIANCWATGGATFAGQGYIIGGFLTDTFPFGIYTANWTLDGDVAFASGPLLYAACEIGAVELKGQLVAFPGGCAFINVQIWGTGTASVYKGGAISNETGASWAACLTVPTLHIDEGGVGSAYDAATGVWTPNVPITVANLDTHVGLCNPKSGSRFIGP